MVLTSAAAAAAGGAAAGAGAGATSGIMATLATMATKIGGALATAGKAAMASGIPQAMGSGALWGAGINAAVSAIQGDSIGDIALSAGKGAAVGAATGGIAKGLSIGAKQVGSLLKANKASSASSEVAKNATTSSNTAPTPNNTAPTPGANTLAPVPGAENVAQPQIPDAGTIGNTAGKPTLRPKASLKGQPISIKVKAAANTGKAVAESGASKAGKIASQVGVQGALSIGSAVLGAKQSAESNAIAKQSLLFQQQSYRDQKAETDKTKAQLKTEAWSDYSSASLFGKQLYDSAPSSNLLTSYNTNGGTSYNDSFSILTPYRSSQKTDIT